MGERGRARGSQRGVASLEEEVFPEGWVVVRELRGGQRSAHGLAGAAVGRGGRKPDWRYQDSEDGGQPRLREFWSRKEQRTGIVAGGVCGVRRVRFLLKK